eukprot:1160675-Pelagomonas_calceolata.AAC.14
METRYCHDPLAGRLANPLLIILVHIGETLARLLKDKLKLALCNNVDTIPLCLGIPNPVTESAVSRGPKILRGCYEHFWQAVSHSDWRPSLVYMGRVVYTPHTRNLTHLHPSHLEPLKELLRSLGTYSASALGIMLNAGLLELFSLPALFFFSFHCVVALRPPAGHQASCLHSS